MTRLTFALFLAAWLALAEGQSCASLPRYVYRADKKTFDEAKVICSNMGARLAVANNLEEAQLLSNLAQHSQNSFEYTFVGRYWDGSAWVTADGMLLADSGYEGWMDREPYRGTMIKADGSRTFASCGAINWNGLHKNVFCELQYPFICEFYSKPCTNP